jgi:hypothetical protein
MSLTTDIFGNKFSSQAVFSTAGLMRVRKGGEKILLFSALHKNIL